MEKSIGISLSGGGARGIMHFGVLKALQEYDMEPEVLVGTSAGAIAAAMYAAGYSPEDSLEIVKKANLFRVLSPALDLKGFLNIESAAKFLRKYLPERFEDLEKPVYVNATDLETGKETFFAEGELLPPVLASCAIPGLFRPVIIDGRHYVDGGVLSNLPFEPLKIYSNFLIASHSNPLGPLKKVSSINSVVERTFLIISNVNIKTSLHHFDLFIEPPQLSLYGISSIKSADAIYQLGYEDACLQIERYLKQTALLLTE
jgi:NTE family protein